MSSPINTVGNYAVCAVSSFNLRAIRDFWRFAVPFFITPFPAALSSKLAVVLHNFCAASTSPSCSANSVFFSDVLSDVLRCLFLFRFFRSARACFFADRLFKPYYSLIIIQHILCFNDTTKNGLCPLYYNFSYYSHTHRMIANFLTNEYVSPFDTTEMLQI